MEAGLTHLPLALFTTLAPMGAAAFLVIAYAFVAGKPDEAQARRIDRWTALPAAFMLAGIVAAFFHLANPMNALLVFAGVGASPLSNELLVTVVFAAVALVYWVLALAGKLPAHGGARTGFAVALALGAVALAIFCGMAYLMDAVPTWNSPYGVVEMIGFALLGGAALGSAVCALAKAPLPTNGTTVIGAVAIAGGVVALAAMALQGMGLGSIANIWGTAASLQPQFPTLTAAFGLCALICCVLLFLGGAKTNGKATGAGASTLTLSDGRTIIALALALVGIFIARIAFYGLFMGVAL